MPRSGAAAITKLRRELAAVRAKIKPEGPCVSIIERRISETGAVKTFHVGSDEPYIAGAARKDRRRHVCSSACLSIQIDLLSGDPEDPGFEEKTLLSIAGDMEQIRKDGYAEPRQRKALEDQRRLCGFYKFGFPADAAALLDNPAALPRPRARPPVRAAVDSPEPERAPAGTPGAQDAISDGPASRQTVELFPKRRPRRIEDMPPVDQPPCATCSHPSRLHSEQSEWRHCLTIMVVGPDGFGNGPCGCRVYVPGEFPPLDAAPSLERMEEA